MLINDDGVAGFEVGNATSYGDDYAELRAMMSVFAVGDSDNAGYRLDERLLCE